MALRKDQTIYWTLVELKNNSLLLGVLIKNAVNKLSAGFFYIGLKA